MVIVFFHSAPQVAQKVPIITITMKNWVNSPGQRQKINWSNEHQKINDISSSCEMEWRRINPEKTWWMARCTRTTKCTTYNVTEKWKELNEIRWKNHTNTHTEYRPKWKKKKNSQSTKYFNWHEKFKPYGTGHPIFFTSII